MMLKGDKERFDEPWPSPLRASTAEACSRRVETTLCYVTRVHAEVCELAISSAMASRISRRWSRNVELFRLAANGVIFSQSSPTRVRLRQDAFG
jgi:hypothetical protein